MSAFDFPASPTINDLYSANNVTYICTGTSPSIWKKLGSDIATGTTKVAVLQDVRSQGTNGGQASANNWHGRRLNSKIDLQNFVTLLNGTTGTDGTANTFSLEAGTYLLQWRAPGYDSGNMRAKMAYTTDANYNTLFNSQSSAGVSYLGGESAQSEPTNESNVYATGSATITISQTTYFRLQHYVTNNNANNDNALGEAGSISGEDEIYSQVIVEDLATTVKSNSLASTRVAVVKDQKNFNVDGGTFFASAWRDRDLTVKDDPFNFVTLYPTTNGQTSGSPGNDPGYFALPAGKYKIKFSAPAYRVKQHMAAIGWSPNESDINKTYATGDFNSGGEIYGTSEYSGSVDGRTVSDSEGSGIVEITQTSYFKVIHYANTGSSNYGFGLASSINSVDPETYTIVEIEDLATAEKSGVNALNKIEQANTKAEVVDTGTDGHFKVTTEDRERFRINSDGDIVFSHLRASDSVQITAGGIYRRVIQIDDSATADGNYVDQIQALFRIGGAHGSFAGTLYVTVNDLMVSMSKVYHFTTSFGAGTTDRIRTIAGINKYATFNFGAGIKYNSSLNGGYPDSMYYRDLCVRVNYTKNRNNANPPAVTDGPESPSISATLILAQNSTGINVTKPTQSYSTLTVTAETTPSSSSSSGMVGEMASDSNYVYVCTDTNTWKRIALDPY